MRKLLRKVGIIVLLSFFLQGCASTLHTQQYQASMLSAKRSFDAGDFKRAFHKLLPLALAGCPEAQYALGYLYYYGYGVSEDTVSGLFWIEEAAKRHYLPAFKALGLLKHRQIHHDWAVEEGPPIPPPPKALIESKQTTLESATVALNKPDKYTLQVFGSFEPDTVKELQARLQLTNSTFLGVTKHQGRDWYVLTYGKYPAMLQAELAKDQLPKGIKQLKPWIRKIENVQWLA